MRALILSGTGRYADPWHPFDKTTPRLATILSEEGFDTSISTEIDDAMTTLEGVSLLVVNAGDPWRSPAEANPASSASLAGFENALEKGIGVLAMHCAVASLRDYPEWFAAIGGMWVPGLSFHPPANEVTVSTTVPGVSQFRVFDECYCRLQRIGRRTDIAHHPEGGGETAAWTRLYRGGRIAVDTLGHDERSYDSVGHQLLIRSLALWASGDDTALVGPLSG